MLIRTIALVAAAATSAITLAGCSTMNREMHSGCRVTHKEILYSVSDGTSHRTKRLSTTCGTFNVGDSLAGGFGSYDTWNQLEEGKVYDIETGGYRFGIFDQFPTVVRVVAR